MFKFHATVFSSPGQSPASALALASASAAASALAKSLTFKFFMRWARRCQASYPVPVTDLVYVMGKALQNVQVSCYSFLCDGQGSAKCSSFMLQFFM